MKPPTLLKRVSINPDETALLVTVEEAMENLLEAIKKYCSNLKINKMKREDIKTLLNSYSACIVNYHPEDYHQERAALLKNFEMLKRYGLADKDYNSIDFY